MMLKDIGEHKEVLYGTKRIAFRHLRMERKTIEVAVHPDCSVTVKSPVEVTDAYLDSRVKKRARWILRQCNYFKQFHPKAGSRFYFTGETHLYLGKSYRLRIEEGGESRILLKHGFFIVSMPSEPSADEVRMLFKKWYREKALIHFHAIFDRVWPLFEGAGYAKPEIYIRVMRSRWGSLSARGALTLNVDLIRAPRECVEYVIIHELCHLEQANHGEHFYHLLSSKLPDWERRKLKLELSLA